MDAAALRRHDNIVGYLFMLPALLFFCCFIIIPMLTGFIATCSSSSQDQFHGTP